MTDPLHSSKYSLAHAKRHVENLKAELDGFFQSNPYTRVIEFGFPNIDLHKVCLVKPMPKFISGTAFDAINSLRAALDQATFATAIATGASGKKAHFPFGDNAAEVAERHVPPRGGSKQVPKEIFDLVASFKPYKGGDDTLWAVNKLCNSHKHEVIIPTALFVGGGSFDAHFDFLREFTFPPVWDSAKNEMVLAVVPHGAKPNYQLKVATFVAFSDIADFKRRPALDVLFAMASLVERILVEIESKAIAIGIFK